MKRGEIYYADLGCYKGSEQGGLRPVLIIQNDTGNKYSPTTIVASITAKKGKPSLPTHIEINLEKPSVILLEQIRTIDKTSIINKLDQLDDEEMKRVNIALKISLGL